MASSSDVTKANQAAWDLVAAKYAPDVDADVEFLRGGGVSLFPSEVEILGDLSNCPKAVHLQCSHGLDTLSLLNLGVGAVVGVDLSTSMLALAERKATALGANAKWVHADVLSLPAFLDGVADLVYTGKGALPWVLDVTSWAAGVARLLRPGGTLFLLEGHPLNWVWEQASSVHELAGDHSSYFDVQPRRNSGFPASAVERLTPEGELPPPARERQWTLGQVVTALANAGFQIERLEEHAEHYWPQFPRMSAAEVSRLPHSFSLVAKVPA